VGGTPAHKHTASIAHAEQQPILKISEFRIFLEVTSALALMETASFCAMVWHKRYSEQQETAPKNFDYNRNGFLVLIFCYIWLVKKEYVF
jgi:hypothetical protein